MERNVISAAHGDFRANKTIRVKLVPDKAEEVQDTYIRMNELGGMA